MPNEFRFSNEDIVNALQNKDALPVGENDISNPDVSLSTKTADILPTDPKELIDYGSTVAQKLKYLTGTGYLPTRNEAKALFAWRAVQEHDAISEISEAAESLIGSLWDGGKELVGDAVTLKAPRIVGSVIEGAATGVKNWAHMADEVQFNEESWLHKMLYNTHNSEEDRYQNLLHAIHAQHEIANDQKNGIWIPPTINIGGMDINLTNPAVVQAVSYVADPAWLMPELGIESTLGKALSSAGKVMMFNEQMAKASVYAATKAKNMFGMSAELAEKASSFIKAGEEHALSNLKDLTSMDMFVTQAGQVGARENLSRGALASLGAGVVRIPAWGTITAVWGGAKLVEIGSRGLELGAKLLSEEAKVPAMRLSERIAAESTNPFIRNTAGVWARTASPMIEWAGATAKTSLHSGMFGGVFGLMTGGEEGFYNGIGSGIAIGGSFHQIGVLHNTVQGGDATRETIKHFLWSTQHYDRYNQEGVTTLLKNAYDEGGTEGQLRTMASIAASERLQRNVKRLILTEERIKAMSTDLEWAEYQKMLADPDWGGVAFRHTLDGQQVTIINADRASRSAVNEEMLHTLLMHERYEPAFKKAAVDALIGTEDKLGALYKMPTENAVRLVEAFRDSYLKLDASTQGHSPETVAEIHKEFNASIEALKKGERPTMLSGAYEEFVAAYWNRFLDDKPIDYLLKSGDLGPIRNAIEWGKSVYRDIMHADLTSSGANFKWGQNPDNFFIEQNSKKRIRVPMLEGLMKHYVKEAAKDAYRGWVPNERTLEGVGGALSSELDHAYMVDKDGKTVPIDKEVLAKEETAGVQAAAREILNLKPEERGLVFHASGGVDAEGNPQNLRFSRGKPKEEKELSLAAWYREMKKNEEQPKASNIRQPEIKRTKKDAETQEGPLENKLGGGWDADRSGRFWDTVWNGNPRIKITGKATPAELEVLRKHLPANVVARFAELNAVIEHSKSPKFSSDVSNVLQGVVRSETREREDGTRQHGDFVKTRKFIPVEINMYFERTLKSTRKDGTKVFEVNSAQLKLTSIDVNAWMKRVDYSWNDLDETGINFKTVRRLFGTKDNLIEACRRLMSNYSNGEKAEAGIKIFKAAGVSERDAAHMRNIVNAVLGAHPTKIMEADKSARSFYNYPLEMQFRQKGEKRTLPTVFTDHNLRDIGKLLMIDGEGFRYNHDNAYQKSQRNFSPSKGTRDHEGYPIPASANAAVRNSVYRNIDGEVLTVYRLNKHNSIPSKIEGKPSVFDYTTEGLAGLFDFQMPTMRGREWTSQSGWMHYTPDKTEAAFVNTGKLAAGYIDTTSHVDISHIGNRQTHRDVIDSLVQRLSDVTGKRAEDIMTGLMRLGTEDGTPFRELYNKADSVFNMQTAPVEEWLFTKKTKAFFSELGVHSIEYNSLNPITGNEFSSVAIIDNGRFIENRTRTSELARYSPSRPRANPIETELKKRGLGYNLDQHLKYVINSEGEVVPNTARISHEVVQDIVDGEVRKIQQLKRQVSKEGILTQEWRENAAKTLKPYVMARLKERFKNVPEDVLHKIADVSLRGYDRTFGEVKGRAFGKDYVKPIEIIRDSMFIHMLKNSEINPLAIAETGIPSLGHWVEMSEREFNMCKILPEYMEAVKQGGKVREEFEAKNADLTALLRDHGGIGGWFNEVHNRHRDLVFLIDNQIRSEQHLGADNPVGGVGINEDSLKQIFRKKTQLFIEQQIQIKLHQINSGGAMLTGETGRLTQQIQSLMRIKNSYELLDKSNHNIQASKADVTAKINELGRQAENLFRQEAHNRLESILIGYGLKPDIDVIDRIRTRMYDLSKKGLVNLGTPDAVRKAVELYIQHERGGADVKKISQTIKKNFIKTLEELDRRGYHGVNWTAHEGNGSGRELSSDLFGTGTKFSHIWTFDGTDFTIGERLPNHDEIQSPVIEKGAGSAQRKTGGKDNPLYSPLNYKYIEMYDGRGNVILSTRYFSNPLDATHESKVRTDFLREATLEVARRPESGIQPLFSKYEVVDGPVKEFVALNYLAGSGIAHHMKHGISSFDPARYDLYRKGNTHVLIERGENYAETQQKIKSLEKEITDGKIETFDKKNKSTGFRKLTLDELVAKREQITELRKKEYPDAGFIFNINARGEIVPILDGSLNFSKFSSQKERTRVLRQLVTGHNTAEAKNGFNNYLKELYSAKDELVKARNTEIQSRIDLIKSAGKEGNLAKIREEIAKIVKLEEGYRAELAKYTLQYNEESARKGSKKQRTAFEVYKALDERKRYVGELAMNQKDSLDALYHQMRELHVNDEFDAMSPEQKKEKILEWAYRTEVLDENVIHGYELPQINGEPTIDFAKRIKDEYATRLAQYEQTVQEHERLLSLREEKEPEIAEIKTRINFLAQQYAWANGSGIPAERFPSYYGTEPALDSRGNALGPKKLTFDLERLKRIGGNSTFSPEYLPDKEGMLGEPEVFQTREEFEKAFREGVLTILDRWRDASTSDAMKIDGILAEGTRRIIGDANLEHSFSRQFAASLDMNQLNASQESFLRDPSNRKIIQKVEEAWKRGDLDSVQALDKIKELYEFASIGAEGINYKKSIAELQSTQNEIFGKTLLLEKLIENKQGTSDEAKKTRKELRALQSKEKSLEKRLDKIAKKAENIHTKPELNDLIIRLNDENDTLKSYREARKQDIKERNEYWTAVTNEVAALCDKYDEPARQLTDMSGQNAGFRNSREVVTGTNPKTASLFMAFPTISSELSGKSLSHFDPSISDYETRGTSDGAGLVTQDGPVYAEVNRNERNRRRPILLADYMWFADKKTEYHQQRPDAPINAEDAQLIILFRKDYAQTPEFQAKYAKIDAEKISRWYEIAHGIKDKFADNTQREQFVKSFVSDAIALISDNVALREEAYKRIFSLSDEEFEARKSQNPELIEKDLKTKEVIENAFYLIRSNEMIDGKEVSLNLVRARKNTKLNNKNEGTFPKKTPQPFETEYMYVGNLVKMIQFRSVLNELTSNTGSLFKDKPFMKVQYEAMPNEQRMNLNISKVNRLLLEQNAGELGYQTEINAQKKLRWDAIKGLDWSQHSGYHGDNLAFYNSSVEALLKSIGTTQSSLERHKTNMRTFCDERTFALDNLLSLTSDGLHFSDLDFTDESKGSFRDSNDGRYVVQRVVRQGEEQFHVFFYGEKINNKDGSPMCHIDTTKIGTVSTATEARVLARFFEDDVVRVKHASNMLTGGKNEFDPLRVNGALMPTPPKGNLIPSLKHAPDFMHRVLTEAVKAGMDIKEAEKVRLMLAGMDNMGEVQYLEFPDAKGQTRQKKLIITPSKEGTLSKYFDRATSPDGHTLWVKKPKAPEAPAEPVAAATPTPADAIPASKDTPAQDAERKTIDDASTWTIESRMPSTPEAPYKEWSVIRNKLNYVIIKLKDANNNYSYRLFNQASYQMGHYYDEQKAVDEIIKQELQGKELKNEHK